MHPAGYASVADPAEAQSTDRPKEFTDRILWSVTWHALTGGGLNFFGGCVPHGFPKVESKERIFLEKWGSWEQKFGKIWV